MSKLSELMHKLLGTSQAAAAPSANNSAGGSGDNQGRSISGGSSLAGSAASSAGASQAPGGSPTGVSQVDIAEVLNGMAAKNPEKLDWRRSIVDLMKLVGMDSSLASRKDLAEELGYTGDTNDSATMNIWLHKQVMQKIAANGGKVPDELKNRPD